MVLEGAWLNQSDDVIVGHGNSLFCWRRGGVKHPHDMLPSQFSPPPTSGHSSKAELKNIAFGDDVPYWVAAGYCAGQSTLARTGAEQQEAAWDGGAMGHVWNRRSKGSR